MSVRVCMHVRMHVLMCVCVLCVCARACMCVRVHVHVCMHVCAFYVRTRLYMFVCVYVCTYQYLWSELGEDLGTTLSYICEPHLESFFNTLESLHPAAKDAPRFASAAVCAIFLQRFDAAVQLSEAVAVTDPLSPLGYKLLWQIEQSTPGSTRRDKQSWFKLHTRLKRDMCRWG